MLGERAIHVATFILLLIGLGSLTAWASYTYLKEQLILQVAAIALGWGVILLILYVGFRALDWSWWS